MCMKETPVSARHSCKSSTVDGFSVNAVRMMSWIGAANNCYHVILSFENISTIPLSFSQRARVDTQQQYVWLETSAFFNPFLFIKIQCTKTLVVWNQMRESSSGRTFTKLSTDRSRKNHTAFVLTVLN